ncbi:MFS transporter, partial [Rhodococcus hoagii]|nr:MFS transporter [Prescottella equi]
MAFLALVGAASFRAAPSILIDPLHDDFGWSRASISAAVSVNLVLYGLTAPFAAALMERFGMRRVVAAALTLVALGSGLTVFMTTTWQLILLWGVLVGLGTGSMALAFVATVVDRWFVARRGLVTGILTAGGAAGQLVFLPALAALSERYDWRTVSLTVAVAALAVVPLVLVFLRGPSERRSVCRRWGRRPTTSGHSRRRRPEVRSGARSASCARRHGPGCSGSWREPSPSAVPAPTGLVGTHFVPAAHDHGMPVTAAAGLLAVIGIFDLGAPSRRVVHRSVRLPQAPRDLL